MSVQNEPAPTHLPTYLPATLGGELPAGKHAEFS